ncbi:MAG TPA: hypothetical protein VK326_11125 [Solirubrobacterales bacterium]|nr:hypothetical protein [Solirubrobacterales bacterium]
MPEPAHALAELASLLRAERSVISPHVVDPRGSAALGLLAASGERSAQSPGEYALVVESVREGYLLHYASGRVVAGPDRDLELLAGDYLYALGLERLAALGDLEAVRELSDLISLAAQVHDTARPAERAAREAAALWLASATAIATGSGEAHDRAKASLRAGAPEAAAELWRAAELAAAQGGIEGRLGEAAFSIDFRPTHLT